MADEAAEMVDGYDWATIGKRFGATHEWDWDAIGRRWGMAPSSPIQRMDLVVTTRGRVWDSAEGKISEIWCGVKDSPM